MARKTTTRDRILDIAEAAVLAKGFEATSIEEIVTEARITKSGFFYHFRGKNELARAMVSRYADANEALFDDIFGRARELSDDPLQAMLIALKLLAETMADLPNGHPGCMVASICYQERLFDRDVMDRSAEAVRAWNARFQGYFEEIAAVHPPRIRVDLADLAEMLSCVVDGGIIMGKLLRDPSRLERQIMTFRSLIGLVFAPAPPTRSPQDVVPAG